MSRNDVVELEDEKWEVEGLKGTLRVDWCSALCTGLELYEFDGEFIQIKEREKVSFWWL